MADRRPVDYYKLGNNMMKDDNGVLYYLNDENVWQFDGELLGYFNGDMNDDDLEKLPSLPAAKKWYEQVTGGKPWVA